MCRLFGMHAGREPVPATFWLLDAPDNLAEQGRRNPDGTGLGVFGADGQPVLRRQPIAAWEDAEFATEAHELSGTTFIAHVRYASTGADDVRNTHPFLQDGRLFAHNGVLTGLDVLDARLAELSVSDLVAGDTDSERVFALITAETRAAGDVETGLRAAVSWLAEKVPIYALNILLATATDMWALRYPEAHELYLLDRHDVSTLDLQTDRIRAESSRPAVVFASEPMDDSPWQLIEPGELVHVDADLDITRSMAFPEPPRHLLTLADLSASASASQHPHKLGLRR